MPYIIETGCQYLNVGLVLTKKGLKLNQCDYIGTDKPDLSEDTTSLIGNKPVRLCLIAPGEYSNPPCDLCKLVSRRVYMDQFMGFK